MDVSFLMTEQQDFCSEYNETKNVTKYTLHRHHIKNTTYT